MATAGVSGRAIALASVGGVLVYAGLRDESPLDAIRGVLTGRPGPLPAGKPVTLDDVGTGSFGPAPAANASVGRAVQVAVAQVGKPYRWGATGPNTFDCSGLIVYSYRQAGIQLPRYWSGAFLTSTYFRKIPRGQVAAGDVLWKPGHVALATSNSQLVEAPRTGIPVRTGEIGNRFRLYLRYAGNLPTDRDVPSVRNPRGRPTR